MKRKSDWRCYELLGLSIKRPDRLNIDRNDRKLYDELKKDPFFKDIQNKELFLLAMAVGFRNGKRHPLERKDGFVRTEYLRSEDVALMSAVALHDSEGDLNILTDKNRVCETAEEYAHAGIYILYNKVSTLQFGSFDKILEQELYEIYNEIKNREKT